MMPEASLLPQRPYQNAVGRLILTDSTCKISGRSYPKIPVLVWPEGIDYPVSDFLRKTVIDDDLTPGTAMEYGKILRPFVRLCRQRKRDWTTVDDQLIRLWREGMRSAGLGPARINTCISVLFAFYVWAEQTRRLRFHVGIYDPLELPADLRGKSFPISAKKTYSKHKNGPAKLYWTSPLTLSEPSSSVGKRHTPTEDEIQRLHEVAMDNRQGVRDSLILSWAEECGDRRFEGLQLRKDQLPSLEEIDEIIDKDQPWPIEVRRKGRKTGLVYPTPDLIIRTLDYIEYERSQVVSRCRSEMVGYKDPPEVFLSETTGRVLHPDSVTSLTRKIFSRAGVKKASLHRLRAKFAIRTIETLLEATFPDGVQIGPESSWVESLLTKAAEMMGQSNPSSLKPYLNFLLNRRLRNSDAVKAHKLSSTLRELERHEQVTIKRLSKQQELQKAAKLIRSGKQADAAELLRHLADDLVS